MIYFIRVMVLLLLTCAFFWILSIGIDKELDRRDAVLAYHVQQCEINPDYCPKLCESLLGKR